MVSIETQWASWRGRKADKHHIYTNSVVTLGNTNLAAWGVRTEKIIDHAYVANRYAKISILIKNCMLCGWFVYRSLETFLDKSLSGKCFWVNIYEHIWVFITNTYTFCTEVARRNIVQMSNAICSLEIIGL